MGEGDGRSGGHPRPRGPRPARPGQLGGEGRLPRRRSRDGVAERADRRHLSIAPRSRGVRTRRGHRGPLCLRPQRPAPRAGSRGLARPDAVRARTGLRARPTRLSGRAHRAHSRSALAPLRSRPGSAAPEDGRRLGRVRGIQPRPGLHAERPDGIGQVDGAVRGAGHRPGRTRADHRPHAPDLGQTRSGHAIGGRRGRRRSLRMAAAGDRGRGRRPAGRAARGLRARTAHHRRHGWARSRGLRRRGRRPGTPPLRRATQRLQRDGRPPSGPDRPLHRCAGRVGGGGFRPRGRPAGLRLRRGPQRHRQRGGRRRPHDRPAPDEGDRYRPRGAHLPRRSGAHLGRARRRHPGARTRRDRRADVHHRARRAGARRGLGLDRAQVRLLGGQPALCRGRHGRRTDPDRLREREPGPVLGHARRGRQLRRGHQLRVPASPDRPDRAWAGC